VGRAVHHFDLWVGDAATAGAQWGWLFTGLGWATRIDGCSWAHADGTYVYLERSPDQVDEPHDRLRPGINHLAFTVDDRATLDRIRAGAAAAGWHELFADRYPLAGGAQHVALYLESSEGIEVEIVVG